MRGALELERVSNDIVRLIGSPVVRNEGQRQGARRGGGSTGLLVHPLGATVLSRLSIEEVRTAIDLSFELIDQVPDDQFQESTGIFFVYGTDQQNDGFMQTIDALTGVAVQRPRRGEESSVDVDATETGPEADIVARPGSGWKRSGTAHERTETRTSSGDRVIGSRMALSHVRRGDREKHETRASEFEV